MKGNAEQREFKKLKNQIKQIEEIVHNSKGNALFEHEATIRKKLIQLKSMKKETFKDFNDIYERYESLLEETGKKILEAYNKRNGTDFDFYEVLRGIITVLTKNHIPKMIAKEFDENFPDNPKDEYPLARRIKRKFYIHLGDTNTGKTYNAIEKLKSAKKGLYLSPLRILALEIFERLNNDNVICDLSTGEEEVIKLGATHMSCTIEKANLKQDYDIVVIDEIQMINDSQRGNAWTRALLGLKCREIHICGALNSKDILKTIIEDCGDEYEIKEYKRNTPLEVQYKSFNYKDVNDGDALIVFSKKRVLEIAKQYADNGIKTSIIYGALPPEVRKMQYNQFINKEANVLVSTDAIGMGVNLPIKRIVFMSIKKFDGDDVRELTSQEVKQVAGRAGRKGIYDIGYVASVGDTQDFIKEKIEATDDFIEKAVVGPSDAILNIKTLPLNEKLALWSSREEKVSYYRKMDISEYLIILDKIKRYRLREDIQWNLLKVPFDVSNEDLMDKFLEYVDELFVAKLKSLTKPECFSGNLEELENYYQKISMYYSFSKIFNLKFDVEWVYKERRRVSDEINEILVGI